MPSPVSRASPHSARTSGRCPAPHELSNRDRKRPRSVCEECGSWNESASRMARPFQGLPRRVQSGQSPLRQIGKRAAIGWAETTDGCGAVVPTGGRSVGVARATASRSVGAAILAVGTAGRSARQAMPSLTQARSYSLSGTPACTAAASHTAFSASVRRSSRRSVRGMAIPPSHCTDKGAGPRRDNRSCPPNCVPPQPRSSGLPVEASRLPRRGAWWAPMWVVPPGGSPENLIGEAFGRILHVMKRPMAT